MRQIWGRFGQRTLALVALVAFTGLGLSSGGVMAQNSKTAEDELKVFDRNNFDRSANIDNKWLPLQPGTQWVYNGFTQEGKNRVPHRVVQTVTDLTKVINGVRTVVVWDVDYKDGNLEESEIVFFAQDKDGNVWLLGELVEKYDEMTFVGGQVWLAGMDGASAGIMMKADPRPGTPSYSQGYAPPPFNWTDSAKVEQIDQNSCVPSGCYKNVLVIAEGSKEEGPDAQQLKYYAPSVAISESVGGLTLDSMSSTTPRGGRRAWTRSIHWPERSARADRFFLAASHRVSNGPSGSARPRIKEPLCRRRSSASPDHDAAILRPSSYPASRPNTDCRNIPMRACRPFLPILASKSLSPAIAVRLSASSSSR
jgi:hypothetical protein